MNDFTLLVYDRKTGKTQVITGETEDIELKVVDDEAYERNFYHNVTYNTTYPDSVYSNSAQLARQAIITIKPVGKYSISKEQ